MKNILFKFLKVFLGIILMLVLIFVVAVLWPMPHMETPSRQKMVFIKSINIIDVQSGNILENRDILIQDNVIIAIDTVGVLKAQPTALVIEGKSKYVLPGLWDMHTHSIQHSEWLHHPLYIANGVTGIRDMSGQLSKKDSYWAGSKERLIWNAELNDNKRVTPRYVLQSSYQIDGASSVPDNFPEFFKLQKIEDVDSLLRFYKNEEVDFIKVYDQILPESYRKLALQAPKYGMHIAGHKPIFVSLEEAILLGQRSFEHARMFFLESFPNADSLIKSNNWKKLYSEARGSMIENYNPEIAKRLMLLMKEHDAYWTPTLQTVKFEAFAHDPKYLDNPNLKYITYISKKIMWDMDANNNKKRNLAEQGKNISADFYNTARKQVKLASVIGVPILTGTDVTDSYVFAGFSMHNELEELTQSGMSNLQVLQSATIIAAKFAKKDKDFGTVEVGKIADLIILNKNPLENIYNSKTINGVILNGIHYDAEKIEELKKFTRRIASSFHMNVKVLYSYIASPLMRVQFSD